MQSLSLQLHVLHLRLSAVRNRIATGVCPAALLLAALTAPQAMAAAAVPDATPVTPITSPAPDAAPQWQFTVSPYLWGAGIRGDVGHQATGTQFVKSDFRDIARDLDVAAMVTGEARYGPYSLLTDVMYISTTTKTRLPDGAPAKHLNTDSKTFSGFLGGGVALRDTPDGRLDATGGVRVWYSSTTLSLHGGEAGGTSGSDSATWADLMAGLRGRYALTPSVWLSGWGMAGAGQSRADWDVAVLVSRAFTPAFQVAAGYRATGVNYRHDGFVYDMVQQGPLLGISGRF